LTFVAGSCVCCQHSVSTAAAGLAGRRQGSKVHVYWFETYRYVLIAVVNVVYVYLCNFAHVLSPVLHTSWRSVKINNVSMRNVRPSVRPSVCLSHSDIVSNWPNVPTDWFHRHVDTPFLFLRTKHYGNISTGTPITGVSVERTVGKNLHFSSDILLYLRNEQCCG